MLVIAAFLCRSVNRSWSGLAVPFLQGFLPLLLGSFALSYFIAFLVSTREARSVDFSKVSKPRLFEVVRALGIVALRLLTIVLSGIEAVLVRLTCSFLAVIKNVPAIVASVW